MDSTTKRGCRFCRAPLSHSFADLGMSPLANAYVKPEQLHAMEPFYPLHAYVCAQCFLVQLEEFESPQHIFDDYRYFSSYSESWVRHAERYTELMIERFGVDRSWQVVEIASNDGYLLLNYCGIRSDFIDYTVDLSPHKQGRYLPGTRVPIYSPAKVAETRPDYLLILPWNLRHEITEQMAHIREWGGQFVVPIPEAVVL